MLNVELSDENNSHLTTPRSRLQASLPVYDSGLDVALGLALLLRWHLLPSWHQMLRARVNSRQTCCHQNQLTSLVITALEAWNLVPNHQQDQQLIVEENGMAPG